MPVQKTKSGLLAKLGTKIDAVAKRHAADATDYGRMGLPPGIIRGVARLIEAKFDIYKTGANMGEYYFRAAGVMVEPRSVMVGENEVPVAGSQTSIMIPCCDTKTQAGKVTTAQEHITGENGCKTNVMNEMRKLGFEFSSEPDLTE